MFFRLSVLIQASFVSPEFFCNGTHNYFLHEEAIKGGEYALRTVEKRISFIITLYFYCLLFAIFCYIC